MNQRQQNARPRPQASGSGYDRPGQFAPPNPPYRFSGPPPGFPPHNRPQQAGLTGSPAPGNMGHLPRFNCPPPGLDLHPPALPVTDLPSMLNPPPPLAPPGGLPSMFNAPPPVLPPGAPPPLHQHPPPPPQRPQFGVDGPNPGFESDHISNQADPPVWTTENTSSPNLVPPPQQRPSRPYFPDTPFRDQKTSGDKTKRKLVPTGSSEPLESPPGPGQQEKDQKWVNSWLARKNVMHRMKPEKRKSSITIPEAKGLVRELLQWMEQLEDLMDSLAKDNIDPVTLAENTELAKKAQNRILEIRSQFEKNNVLEELIARVKKTQKKRERIKRLRKEHFIEEQKKDVKRAALHEKLDSWQEGLQQKQNEVKRAKVVKANADETLGEVRRKLQDVKRSLEALKGLRKLRQLRKESAIRRGQTLTPESDTAFEKRVSSMRKLMQKQQKIYEDEQRTLQVMLDHETEELNEVEVTKKRHQKEELLRRRERQINRMLFGIVDIPEEESVKLAPYREYYEAADKDLTALVQIRHSWDMYLVPDGTAGAAHLPPSWVVPVEPTSASWASSLKDNQQPAS